MDPLEEHLSVRLPIELVNRIRFLQRTHEEKTGFHLSKSSIVRKLLEEAFKTRESKLYESSKTQETRK